MTAALVVAVFLVRTDTTSIVQINQFVVGAVITLVSLVAAIDSGKWLG